MSLCLSSRNRLTPHSARHFAGDTLFDRVARALCAAGCLPRKELFEAWEVARRVRRHLRGQRVVDLCAGHGLVAQLVLLLDRRVKSGLCVDRVTPPSAARVQAALADAFPSLAGRVTQLQAGIADVPLAEGDLAVAVHACGRLTDTVLERAAAARAQVAVLPCCHELDRAERGGLSGWLDPAVATDVMRAGWLRERGYRVWTHVIDEAITPQNRLLLGAPLAPGTRAARG